MHSVEVVKNGPWLVDGMENVAGIADYLISSSFIRCLDNTHSYAHVVGGNDFLSMTDFILSYF